MFVDTRDGSASAMAQRCHHVVLCFQVVHDLIWSALALSVYIEASTPNTACIFSLLYSATDTSQESVNSGGELDPYLCSLASPTLFLLLLLYRRKRVGDARLTSMDLFQVTVNPQITLLRMMRLLTTSL